MSICVVDWWISCWSWWWKRRHPSHHHKLAISSPSLPGSLPKVGPSRWWGLLLICRSGYSINKKLVPYPELSMPLLDKKCVKWILISREKKCKIWKILNIWVEYFGARDLLDATASISSTDNVSRENFSANSLQERSGGLDKREKYSLWRCNPVQNAESGGAPATRI